MRSRSCLSPRRAAGAAISAGAALLTVACGGSHPAGSGASAHPGLAQAMASFVRCMHRHGLPDLYITRAPASPGPGTLLIFHGFHGFAIQGAALASPQFASASTACRHLLPMGPPPTAAELHKQFVSALKSARCMRSHGYPGWPDPQIVNGRVGVTLPPPGIDTSSPRFRAVARACGQPVPPGG